MALRLADPGDPTPLAFDAFYAAYARRVRGLVRRRVADDATVDDLVQEVFLRVHRVAERFDATQPAWPWLATITANVCTDAARRGQRDAAPSGDIVALADRRPAARVDPADLYDDRTQMAAIGTALRAVEPRQRRTLIRRELEGLAYRELADREGVTEDTVRSLLKRARVRFRAEYEAAARAGGVLGGVVAIRRRWSRCVARLHRPLARVADTTSVIGAPVGAFLMATGLAVAIPTAHNTAPASPRLTAAVAGRAASTSLLATPSQLVPPGTRRVGSPAPRTVAQPRPPRTIDAAANAGIGRDGDHMTLFGTIGINAGEYGNSSWISIDPGCTFSAVWETACAVADALPRPIRR